jgi:hypothetical protein
MSDERPVEYATAGPGHARLQGPGARARLKADLRDLDRRLAELEARAAGPAEIKEARASRAVLAQLLARLKAE